MTTSSYKDRILAGLPETTRKVAAEANASTEKAAEKAAAEAEEAQRGAELEAKAAEIGGAVVELLQDNDVPQVPVFRSRKSGVLYEDGVGWLVDTAHALTDDGVLHTSPQTSTGKTAHIDISSPSGTANIDIPGIVNPTPLSAAKAVGYWESPAGEEAIRLAIVRGGETETPADEPEPAPQPTQNKPDARQQRIAAELKRTEQAIEGLVASADLPVLTARAQAAAAVSPDHFAAIPLGVDIHSDSRKRHSCTGNCAEDKAIRAEVAHLSEVTPGVTFSFTIHEGNAYITARTDPQGSATSPTRPILTPGQQQMLGELRAEAAVSTARIAGYTEAHHAHDHATEDHIALAIPLIRSYLQTGREKAYKSEEGTATIIIPTRVAKKLLNTIRTKGKIFKFDRTNSQYDAGLIICQAIHEMAPNYRGWHIAASQPRTDNVEVTFTIADDRRTTHGH